MRLTNKTKKGDPGKIECLRTVFRFGEKITSARTVKCKFGSDEITHRSIVRVARMVIEFLRARFTVVAERIRFSAFTWWFLGGILKKSTWRVSSWFASASFSGVAFDHENQIKSTLGPSGATSMDEIARQSQGCEYKNSNELPSVHESVYDWRRHLISPYLQYIQKLLVDIGEYTGAPALHWIRLQSLHSRSAKFKMRSKLRFCTIKIYAKFNVRQIGTGNTIYTVTQQFVKNSKIGSEQECMYRKLRNIAAVDSTPYHVSILQPRLSLTVWSRTDGCKSHDDGGAPEEEKKK